MKALYWAVTVMAAGVVVLVPTDESHASNRELTTLELRARQVDAMGLSHRQPRWDTIALREADLRAANSGDAPGLSASGAYQRRHGRGTDLNGRAFKATSERIDLHLSQDLGSKLVDSQSENTRLEFDSAYTTTFSKHTEQVQDVDSIHEQGGEAYTETRLAGEQATHRARSLEADLKLRMPFNLGENSTLSPYIGAAGNLSQQRTISSNDASASPEQLTSRMVGATMGLDYKQALNDRTILDAGVEMSLFHTTSYLGAQADPMDAAAVAESARDQATGIATRSRLKLGIQHHFTNDFSMGVFANADYWTGLAKVTDQSGTIDLSNTGDELNYAINIKGEWRF